MSSGTEKSMDSSSACSSDEATTPLIQTDHGHSHYEEDGTLADNNADVGKLLEGSDVQSKYLEKPKRLGDDLKKKLYAVSLTSSLDSDTSKGVLSTDDTTDVESHDPDNAERQGYSRLTNEGPFTPQHSIGSNQEEVSHTRPLSLSLDDEHNPEQSIYSTTSNKDNSPTELVSYVAEDLTEKIKLSSPGSRRDSLSSVQPTSLHTGSSSNYSISSISSVSTSASNYPSMSRSPSGFQNSPTDIPPIDPKILDDLGAHAVKVADSLDLMMGNLKNTLHKTSAIAGACTDVYQEAVDNTCDSVDTSIKSMYALMAKCEELSKSMTKLDQLQEQIKEIKRILDMFETQVTIQD